ncbi:hypothetical protein Scep_029559 [Stephania cephalantha]|uniref:Uncharacterized protein n=1 Tax=Stephania cephalantha TaxID=152367 RepID=A0AAP0E178_9MAGN
MTYEFCLLEAATTMSLSEVPDAAEAHIYIQVRVPTISIPSGLECRRADVMYQRFKGMSHSLDFSNCSRDN